MFCTKCVSSLEALNACRLDIEFQKITKLFSLLRRMRANASEIAYSSALKLLAVFGSLVVLVVLL